MKKRFSLKLNNKGSGIVTVLIAVVLLTLMGSLLLMLAFTGFEMKASDRSGKQNAYDASTAMDEIKVGIQNVVSQSIESSYAYALNRFSEKGAEVQNKFSENFIESLKKSKVNGENLIYTTGTQNHYRVSVIKDMIVNCREGEAKVTTNEDDARLVVAENKQKITFKNVSVSYTNKGRTTSITTDINVTVPDISHSFSQFSASGVPSFSAIVGGELIQNGTAATVTSITGGAYMDDLVLKSDSQLILKDGIFVCRNNADISGHYTNTVDGQEVKGRIIADTDSTFWANNVIMRGSSDARFLGNTYVANDLNFAGNNSELILSGTYTGFGIGGESGKDPSKSSSIIVNGKKNKIDMEGLANLVLAGFSFVGESPLGASGNQFNSTLIASDATKIKMGESFSVRENQRIYLVPDGFISYDIVKGEGQNTVPRTNPDIFSNDYSFVKDENGTYLITKTIIENDEDKSIQYKVTFDTTKTLWTKDGKPQTFASYNAQLQPVCMVVNNQLIVYYFITFNETKDTNNEVKYTANDNANRYFKDYVAANPSLLNSYVGKYIEASGSKVASQTMGNFFVGGGTLTFRDYLSNTQSLGIESNSEQYMVYYSNMCQTLTYTQSSTNPDDNPFTYYINIGKITTEIPNVQEFKDENGVVSALVVNGNYVYNDHSSSDIHLIIATGNVTVQKSFKGLIFCNGELHLDSDASLTANSKEVEKAYSCTAKVGGEERVVGDYFKVSIGEGSEESGSTSSIYSRSIPSLVTYSNWKKN